MNRKEFAKFYAIGLEFSCRENPPTMYNNDCDEIDAESNSFEYAFYFAKQACSDVRTRGMREWGRMPWLKWALFYQLPSFIAGLFKTKKVKKPMTAEALMSMLDGEGKNHS